MEVIQAVASLHGLYLAGITIAVGSLIYLAANRRQRDIVLKRLRLRTRPSDVDTPPRSFSPEKKQSTPATDKPADYADIFPPNQRESFMRLVEKLPQQRREAFGNLIFDEVSRSQNQILFDQDYRDCDDTKYTAGGFSIREINALGPFPDYAELSDVPPPVPYTEFKVETALPRPYRPFRWAYHQTMSLTRLEPDWWLELENTYKLRIAQRKDLYKEHGESVLARLPGSELACKEIMEMSIQFICQRYPQYFELAEDKKTFTNRILDTVQDITAKNPLLILLDNIPEDFVLMLRHPETGYYHFRAGVICSAIGWNTGTKIGKRLHEIHAPVPDYMEKMQFSMDRYFAKMPTFKPIQRGSWGLELDQPLFVPPKDPSLPSSSVDDNTQLPDLTRERCHLRVDWQTLRRLPLSGAICFNFKALFTPINEFRDEPYIPSIILKVLREGKENILAYKSPWNVTHVVIPALEEFEREQIEKGVMETDWETRTLDESPWFPGWEEKWHRQQGF